MVNQPFKSILSSIDPMILFPMDYPLTDQEVVDLKALYGQKTIIQTSPLVPSGRVLKVNLPDPIARMENEAAALDRLLRRERPAPDVAES